jgi:cytochrome c biogenesis protein CcmG, thiol:disulfide interchange protein DsbE
MTGRTGADPYADLSRRTTGGGAGRGLVVAGVAAVALVVLAVVAVLLAGGDGTDGSEAVQEVAAVEVPGDALPPFPEVDGLVAPVEEDPAVGMTPSAIRGQDFAGESSVIDPADGRSKVVVFLAHWCPHCQKELPMIQRWAEAGNLPEDVELWAVVTGTRSDQNNYPPSQWLAREGWSGGVVLDNADTDAATSWGLTGFPYLVFLDADGRVARRASGELPESDLDALAREISGT